MRDLYDWSGLPLTAEIETRMSRWLGENQQHGFGRAEYTLHDCGLSTEELARVFEGYLAAFDIELEGDA